MTNLEKQHITVFPVAKWQVMEYTGINGPIRVIYNMVTADLQLEAALQDAPSSKGSVVLEMPNSELETRLLRTSVTRIQLQRLAMRGLHASEAAKLLGISSATARSHYSDPDFRRAVLSKVDGAFIGTDAEFIERARTLTERLEEQATKSFQALQEMLEPDTNKGREISDNLKYRIHTGFLDRHSETATITKAKVTVDPILLAVAARAAIEMDNVVTIKKSA